MNATELNPAHAGEFDISRTGADTWLRRKRRESALKLFVKGAWGGKAVCFPPRGSFIKLGCRATRYLD